MNPSDVSSRSQGSPPSTLRPRTRRLISLLDDHDEDFGQPRNGNGHAAVEMASGANSNMTSQLSSAHGSPSRGPGRVPSGTSSALGSSLAGAFSNSLLTLQGLASNVLGTDGRGSSNGPAPRTRPVKPDKPAVPVRRRSANSMPPAEWGPAPMSPTRIGAGTREGREALVRDAKRKGMLSANGHSLIDSTGRHKRRISDDIGSSSLPPPEDQEGDALVYIHHVQPRDTLAGLTIKYSCAPNVLRKANRMWPNDPVQVRKTILLPVDACGVRGRRVPGPESHQSPEEEDLLGDYTITMHESPSSPAQAPLNGWHRDQNPSSVPQPSSSDTFPSSPTASSAPEPDQPWKHESWVVLQNDSRPTEIARLPRRDLGYFPRARRKSVTFSDIGTSRNTSFDFTRPGTSSPALAPVPSSPRVRAIGSPLTGPQSSHSRPSLQINRTRSSSNTMQSFLSGPGGVGSLGKSARKPGPGPDRLNDVIGPKLPNFLAPPSANAPYMPWVSSGTVPADAVSDDLMSFGPASGSGMYVVQPGTATPSGGSGMDLQELGGAVESWVRKMAKKASTALDSGPAASSARNPGVKAIGVGVGSGTGDLIEMVDAFAIGEGEEALLQPSNEGLLSGGAVMPTGSSETSAFDVGGDGDVRGRRRMRTSSSGSKYGKED
jgi:hypothetical protein